MGTDYHTTDPVSVRPNPVDLAWLDEYRAMHGDLSRNSVFSQALAAFRMDREGWSAPALLDVLNVIVEALAIPDAATVGDAEIRAGILEKRQMIMLCSIKALLDQGPRTGRPDWTCQYIREQLAQNPPDGYRTDYAEVIADRDGITVEQAREQLAAGSAAYQAAREDGASVADAIQAAAAAIQAAAAAHQ